MRAADQRPAGDQSATRREADVVSRHPVDDRLVLIAPVPRIALTQQEACAALGCSEEFFVEHVRPYMRVVRRGRKRLFPVDELRRVIDALADNAL